MSRYLLKTTAITIGTALMTSVSLVAQAADFRFDWTGQIAGFGVRGTFGYDENQSYPGGIVSTGDLDYLNVSFFAPDGSPLRTYNNNHQDPGVNFNFNINTMEILQAGSYNAPDGISIGAPNYDRESGNDPIEASGLTFWSKPPRSETPHLHVDDWADEFGFPIGFSTHEDVAFPTRTTQELIDDGRVGEAYLPPLGNPVTPLGETGQFAQVTPMNDPVIPEPTTIIASVLLAGLIPFKRKLKV